MASKVRPQSLRLWMLLQAWPRAVLVACLAVAIVAFLRNELHITAGRIPFWWTWYDQGQYLASTLALAAGDLNPAQHHYPIGYALAAAPFAHIFRHDPFVVVDLLCLGGSLWAFIRLGEILDVPRIIGAAIFLATSVFTRSILLHYVIPWTTTPTAFLILAGFTLGFLPPTYYRALLLGLIPGLIVLTKPVDAIALVPLASYYAVACLRAPPPGATTQHGHTLRLFAMGIAGLCAGLAIAVIAHWLVNGSALSQYEADTTRGTVFVLRSLPYKLYSLFVDPAAIYGNYLGTQGIFARYPWVFVGVCGMILTSVRDSRLAILTLGTAVYVAMYAAYYDMMPNSLWNYNSIHYYTWCFPIFGLFAFLLARRLSTRPFAADAIILFLACVLLLAWRPVLQPAAATVTFDGKTSATVALSKDEAPTVIDLDGMTVDKHGVYFGQVKVRWSGIDLVPGHDSRAIPTPNGARVLLMRQGDGRSLTISWAGIGVRSVRSLTLYRLTWTFL